METVRNPVILVALTVLIAFSNGSESSDGPSDAVNTDHSETEIRSVPNGIDNFDLSEVLVSANTNSCSRERLADDMALTDPNGYISRTSFDFSNCHIQLFTSD